MEMWNKMKVFILGCNGMAGHTISLYFKEKGYDVYGFARKKSKFIPTFIGDAKNLDLIKSIIWGNDFDCVINCIGLLNQFAEQNKEDAVFLNSFLPHYLAFITKEFPTKIVHISTDCVFSGKKGNYKESDSKDGETFYDRTKALGELENEKDLTLRNSIIGPDINPSGIGLFNWFMQQTGEIKGYTNAIWTGQTTLQLAKTIEKAIEVDVHGLYNMVPDNSISKFELLCLFNKYFKNNSIKIIPYKDFYVNKSLKRTKFDFEYIIPDYETMISEMYDWIDMHKDFYPHYKL